MKPRIITIFLFLLLIPLKIYSQTSLPDKVPKQYSFEAGYGFLTSPDFDINPRHGINIGVDYAWQLTGLTGKKPKIFISVPLTYAYYFSTNNADSALSMLTYGWRVRHQLTKSKKVIPYLGYYLLLNQMKVFHRAGSIMGHQTKFEFGLDFHPGKNFSPFIQLEYSMTRFPSLDNKESRWAHSVGLKSGIRF
jgi:hypothetical protein